MTNEPIVLVRKNRTQVMLCADVENPTTHARILALLPERVEIIYSDPPWNPGNSRYWRTHAGKQPGDYGNLLHEWCRIVSECVTSRGLKHLFCEQSVNDQHRQMFFDALKDQGLDWELPFLEEWTVYYGSPGSISVRHPNKLLHFGKKRILTDPTDMAGEPMTIRVFAGLGLDPGTWVLDPCMGKGMTSRMAHYFDLNCVGVELNEKRLEKTLQWLTHQGFTK